MKKLIITRADPAIVQPFLSQVEAEVSAILLEHELDTVCVAELRGGAGPYRGEDGTCAQYFQLLLWNATCGLGRIPNSPYVYLLLQPDGFAWELRDSPYTRTEVHLN